MNVTMVVPFLSRAGGGLFDSVRRLAQEVNQLDGTEVRVIGASDSFTTSDEPSWGPVGTTALAPFGPKILGWTPRLGRELLQSNPDVIHHHGLWSLNAFQVTRLVVPQSTTSTSETQSPPALVVSTHGMADRWALNHSKLKKLLAWHSYQRSHLQHAACTVVASPTEGQTLRDQGVTCPIVVIPNGVDPPKGVEGPAPWSSVLGQERRVLLYLGRLHRKKGLRELLTAWAGSLRDNATLGSTWSFVCTGWDDGGHEQELRQLSRDLGLALPHLHFTGPLFDQERDRALTHADALVLPSLSEGMPMSVLEGMAFGLPVLISDACNLPLVFAQGAGFRANPTPASLRDALDALAASSDAKRKEMGTIGRELVRAAYSWQTIARATQTLYAWARDPSRAKPDLTWI